MRNSRAIITMTVLTTAVCAQQLALVPPVLRPVVVGVATRLASRLQVSLQRVVPGQRLRQGYATGKALRVPKPMLAADLWATIPPVEFTPFQFRLPPPVC